MKNGMETKFNEQPIDYGNLRFTSSNNILESKECNIGGIDSVNKGRYAR